MQFDLKTFAELRGRNVSVANSLGVSFGVPSCILNLSKDLLRLIPSSIVGDLLSKTSSSKGSANSFVLDALKKLNLSTGVFEFYTDDGKVTLYSDNSQQNNRGRGSRGLNNTKSFVGILQDVTQAGGNLYNNYVYSQNRIEAIKNCLDNYQEFLALEANNALDVPLDAQQRANIAQANFGKDRQAIDGAVAFIETCDSFIKDATEILAERAADPSLEPEFDARFGDIPFNQGIPDEEDEDEVFRLVFGPPESSTGRFLLSVDGLYFDSQSNGISPILVLLEEKIDSLVKGDLWKFEQDANLGGKGTKIDKSTLNDYVGTVFDDSVIDESSYLEEYYEKDEFLQKLIESKTKVIYDLSGNIQELQGKNASVALIENVRQGLISEAARKNVKINKRKKQIEIAVKIPSIYGNTRLFSPGQVPINNFGYLRQFNYSVELQKQRNLILDTDGVSGVVLPLKPEFVIFENNEVQNSPDHLIVADIDTGSIIHDGSGAYSTIADKEAVRNSMSVDSLIAIYNFLETEAVSPGSDEFTLNNSYSSDPEYNAQLVSKRLKDVYFRGLGIPYLDGICKLSTADLTSPSGVGNFVKLPDKPEFQDLMYSKDGFTLDFWTHVPTLFDARGGWSEFETPEVSSQYRIILGCENVGIASGATPQGNLLRLNKDNGDDVVRGFLMGFTRDDRFKNADPDNNFDCSTLNDIRFFLAPTQSMNASNVGFIGKPVGQDCVSSANWYGMSVPLSAIGTQSLSSIADEFKHLSVTVDPKAKVVKLYCDSELIATSSTNDVFGVNEFGAPRLPSFYKNNSFNYSGTQVGTLPTELSSGPRLNEFFTPWIIGGGYTDGLKGVGNFLGSDFGGRTSGYKGHLGSFKFYKKPISSKEVSNNFKAQEKMFKNVRSVEGNDALVFFLLGQSNMAGGAYFSDLTPEVLGDRHHLSSLELEDVFIYDYWREQGITFPEPSAINASSADWYPITRQNNNQASATKNLSLNGVKQANVLFGPELEFARQMKNYYPHKKIYIFKFAEWSAPLSPDYDAVDLNPPPWSKDASAGLYQVLLSGSYVHPSSVIAAGDITTDVNYAAASSLLTVQGKSVQIGGVFWMQGEADSVSSVFSQAYSYHLQRFIHDLRTDLGVPDLPFIAGKVHPDISGAASVSIPAANITQVRNALEEVEDLVTNFSFYETSGYSLGSDSLHYDASGQIQQGFDMVQTYINNYRGFVT